MGGCPVSTLQVVLPVSVLLDQGQEGSRESQLPLPSALGVSAVPAVTRQ